MSYTTEDFEASLATAKIDKSTIASVIAAWGGGDGMGRDSGPGWSAESVSNWDGGFLCKTNNNLYLYVCGWNDYTGWGCQDGVEAHYYGHVPNRDELPSHQDRSDIRPHDWDDNPVDLNRWLSAPAK